MSGEIHDKKSMFMRTSVGSARDPETGREFELSYGMNGTPIITEKKTKKIWTIGWNELINMAVKAGISEED